MENHPSTNMSASAGRTIISTTMRASAREPNPRLHQQLIETTRKNMQLKDELSGKGFSVNIQTNTKNTPQSDSKSIDVEEKEIDFQPQNIKFEISINGNPIVVPQENFTSIINNQEKNYQIPESQISESIAVSTINRNVSNRNITTASKENLQIVAKENRLSNIADQNSLRSTKEKDKKYTALVKFNSTNVPQQLPLSSESSTSGEQHVKKKRGAPKHPVWEEFFVLSPEVVQCKYCTYLTTGTVTFMIKHLKDCTLVDKDKTVKKYPQKNKKYEYSEKEQIESTSKEDLPNENNSESYLTSRRRVIKRPKRFEDSIIDYEPEIKKERKSETNSEDDYNGTLFSDRTETHIKLENDEGNSLEDPLSIRGYMCSKCHSISKSEEEFNKHLQKCRISQVKARVNKVRKFNKVKQYHGRKESEFRCPKCGWTSNKKFNLLRHISRRHGTAYMNYIYNCFASSCTLTFVSTTELINHLKEVHPNILENYISERFDSIEDLVNAKGEEVKVIINTNENLYECEKCAMTFPNKDSLTRHSTSKRGCQNSKHTCLHPSCNRVFYRGNIMIRHVKEAHPDIPIEESEHKFKSFEEFLQWKDIEEAVSLTKYSEYRGRKLNKDGSCLICFMCVHTGDRDTRPRATSKLHRKGCVKTGLFCPARMTTRAIADGTVYMTYIRTHTHDINVQNTIHYALASNTVKYIQRQLLQGVHKKKIQQNLRQGFRDPETLDKNGEAILRRHEVSLHLIYDTGRRMNVESASHLIHIDDASAIDSLVKQLMDQECNPIITYKPLHGKVVIGALELDELPFSENLFALGIQTRQQLDIMRGGDSRVLSVDLTYCKNQFQIFLITLLLPDGYGKGYPVAHFMTSNRDERTLHYLFSSLKERCPSMRIKAVMTDDSKSGSNVYKGMQYVFGEVRHLLCHDYLNRLFKWRLKNSCKENRSIQIEISTFLSAMMCENQRDFFHDLYRSFVMKYGSQCEQFVNSFTKGYMNRPEKWALCYRNDLGECDVSIPVNKEFQEKLKEHFPKTKGNRRSSIHDLTAVLINFWKDVHIHTINDPEQGVNSDSEHSENDPIVHTVQASAVENNGISVGGEVGGGDLMAVQDSDQLMKQVMDQLCQLQDAVSDHPHINNNTQLLYHISDTTKQLLQQCQEAMLPPQADVVHADVPYQSL